MNLKNISAVLFFGLLTGASLSVSAQYTQDLLRFSMQDPGGSARFKGIGNAQTSLGGDLSSIHGNPAGLGFYNQSDFSVSLDYLNNKNSAQYFGQNTDMSLDKLGFNQIGIVFNIPSKRNSGADLQSGWLNYNIGIGYSKNAFYNSSVGYTGLNPNSTFAHFLADERDLNPNSLLGDFGWDSYLIDFADSQPNNTYYYPSVLEGNNRQQNKLVERGDHSVTNISLGSNISNKFYLGVSLGFTSFRYDYSQKFDEFGMTKSYDDIYRENPNSDFVNPNSDAYQLLEADYELSYNYLQKTTGSGFNGTIGFIYKPIPQVNIGFSATTPTWYSVQDESTSYFDTWYFDNAQATQAFYEYNSDEYTDYLEYNMSSPYKISGGISAIFGNGLISADVDFMDYSSMKFSASDALGTTAKSAVDAEMKEKIRTTYTGVVNFRVGGEYRFTDQFLGRVGFSTQGSPYKNEDIKTQVYSAGLGYRVNRMYIDVAYQNRQQEYSSSPYSVDNNFWGIDENPTANIDNQLHSVFLTLGFKF